MKLTVNGVPLGDDIKTADSFWLRFRGLMGRRALAPGEGLLLKDCSSIHCMFMRFPIDVLYVSGDMTVVGVETVKPWRLGRLYKGARHVLELAENAARDVRAGDKLVFESTDREVST